MPDDFELFAPTEGEGKPLEGLSEEAKQRFAAAARAMQEERRREKQAKKKDDQVARAIIQFLNDDRYAHLFILISRLVARNCPSIFILGILSLIDGECLKATEEYFAEQREPTAHETVEESIHGKDGRAMTLIEGKELEESVSRKLIDWITRLQMVLTHEAERILASLLLDPSAEFIPSKAEGLGAGPHIDGSVLQLTVFVLQEFFRTEEKKELPYEKAQPLTASILQTVFEPFLEQVKRRTSPSDYAP